MRDSTKDQLRILMGYSHFAVNEIFQAEYDICLSTGIPVSEDQYDEGNNNVEFGLHSGSCRKKAHKLFVADEMLYQVIREGDGTISYIFQRESARLV